MNDAHLFYKKEVEQEVDFDKLKKKLIELSAYSCEDIEYLLSDGIFGFNNSYIRECGYENSLIAALLIIGELRNEQGK